MRSPFAAFGSAVAGSAAFAVGARASISVWATLETALGSPVAVRSRAEVAPASLARWRALAIHRRPHAPSLVSTPIVPLVRPHAGSLALTHPSAFTARPRSESFIARDRTPSHLAAVTAEAAAASLAATALIVGSRTLGAWAALFLPTPAAFAVRPGVGAATVVRSTLRSAEALHGVAPLRQPFPGDLLESLRHGVEQRIANLIEGRAGLHLLADVLAQPGLEIFWHPATVAVRTTGLVARAVVMRRRWRGRLAPLVAAGLGHGVHGDT